MRKICQHLEELSALCRSAALSKEPEAAEALREAANLLDEARRLLDGRDDPVSLRLVK